MTSTARSSLFAENWREAIIAPDATLRQALEAISRSGAMMACLVGSDARLEAILTDSDVRRALLKGADMSDSARKWANHSPLRGSSGASIETLVALCEQKRVRELPLVDEEGRLADIFVLISHQSRGSSGGKERAIRAAIPNSMLILAGGLGQRLRTVVNDRPKPLAIVGGRPILETVIQNAREAGITRFYVSVNYLAEQIEEHLRLPQYRELDIGIVRETHRLGTAGCIGLISEQVEHPLVVCNADVLTKAPFEKIIEQHAQSKAVVTCTVRPFRFRIPFGVVEIAGNEIGGFHEKPEYSFLVNAGIYVLDAALCKTVERDKYLDMPELIAAAMRSGGRVSPFVLHEYWIDIGQPEDFHAANAEFHKHFGDSPSET